MPLKVAVQMDPIERIDIRGDSTFALMLEAQRRGSDCRQFFISSAASKSLPATSENVRTWPPTAGSSACF